MANICWSNKLDNIIRQNYKTKSDQQTAILIGCSLSALKHRKAKLGLVSKNTRESNKYNINGLRLCTKCKNFVEPEKFAKRDIYVDGLASWCNVCVRVASRRSDLKDAAFSMYRKACVCCKENHPMALTIDHIDNNGTTHRKQIKTSIYKWLVKNNYPVGFQTLCWNCNMMKYLNGGTCPHKEANNG
jgi:hypothetical protein